MQQKRTICDRCGKHRRDPAQDSELCPNTESLIPSRRNGTHVYGGHLWARRIVKKG